MLDMSSELRLRGRQMHPAKVPNQPVNSNCSRRQFLAASALLGLNALTPGCKTPVKTPEPIIDIHQHVSYSGRPDEVLLTHQRAMGISKTILLPAGRSVNLPSTHGGTSNGLQAKCLGNEECYQFAQAYPNEFLFGANEVPDVPGALREIEKYLRLGAIIIGEQKFGVECDGPLMDSIYDLAADYHVPVLMHWQVKMYNYGFQRFYKVLEKHPGTKFIGHAQTWWANIDQAYRDDPANLYPKGKVTRGGLTDRYLSDYPNMFGDLSAGSGLNALTRDEAHAREFLQRHQDKLLYGSDCSDHVASIPGCQGLQTIQAVRRIMPSERVQRKLFSGNARRILRIGLLNQGSGT
jgi:predicted TIM-barrel fold metal-dependent hydrolase